MDPIKRPVRIRQNIYLPIDDAKILRQLAEDTEAGNLSRLIRRLVRDEAERRDLSASSKPNELVAA